ncbi:MAG: hypothetical protein VR72_19065 [Clostridiaceae bacterium BRH_c20a]|nr:MAG: hypothetical protein VR72_19065 [Clostridiaceae bacterium BRH_c20a]
MVKVFIDQDLCIGCEACPELCPELFDMYPNCDFAYALTEEVPSELEKCAQEAAQTCPVQAILIKD